MPLEILQANDASYFANHTATPSIILHCLSQHNDVKVCIAVAENKNTHPFTGLKLAQDGDPELRYALADNQQMESGILNILAADKNPLVADRAQKTLWRLDQAATSDDLVYKTNLFNSVRAFDS